MGLGIMLILMTRKIGGAILIGIFATTVLGILRGMAKWPAAIFSWLIAFNVVNTRNQFVGTVAEFLYRITEPALRPIRRRMPNFGGIDISPLILVFIIIFIRYVIRLYILPNVF